MSVRVCELQYGRNRRLKALGQLQQKLGWQDQNLDWSRVQQISHWEKEPYYVKHFEGLEKQYINVTVTTGLCMAKLEAWEPLGMSEAKD